MKNLPSINCLLHKNPYVRSVFDYVRAKHDLYGAAEMTTAQRVEFLETTVKVLAEAQQKVKDHQTVDKITPQAND